MLQERRRFWRGMVVAGGLACLAGLAAGGEGDAADAPAVRPDENVPTQADVARAAAELGQANEAARRAAAEFARADAVAGAAAEAARSARAAADQATAAARRSEEDAAAAEEDAAQADRNVSLAGDDKGGLAEARAKAAHARAVAVQARFAATQASARAGQLSRAADDAAGAYRRAAALRAAAARTAAQASTRQDRALRAYRTASLALMARDVASAEQAMKSGDYSRVSEQLKGIVVLPQAEGSAELARRARELAREVERMASDKLYEARLLRLQGREPEVLEVLKSIVERFPRTRAADEAAELMAGDPRLAAVAGMLAAEELDRGGLYAEAAAGYAAIIKRYPESVQALKARLRLRAMEKDETVAAATREDARRAAEAACPGWLAMARSYRDNGLTKKARELFQKIVTDCPDSECAKEARQALSKLESAGGRLTGRPQE